jgi:hypothetical protein
MTDAPFTETEILVTKVTVLVLLGVAVYLLVVIRRLLWPPATEKSDEEAR